MCWLTLPTTALGRDYITERELSTVTVRNVVRQLDHGKHQDEGIRKSLIIIAMISEDYPSGHNLAGSATIVIQYGGVGGELVSSPKPHWQERNTL